ncbi:MAG: phosphotriesterase-related protein, partial [Chloroflexi bacterium]|nr:phosphotriesterase-related protein [Chloroflexota bacterium]
MPVVRTVLGDIKPEQMGITYPHEHIVLGYTGAREDIGPSFNREAVIKEILNDLGKA